MVTVSSKKGTPSSRANAKRGASPKTPRKRQNARKRQQAQASRTPGRVTTTLQGAAKDGVTVILLSLGTFLLLAFFSHTMSDPSWFHTGPENTRVANWMGHVGALVSDSLYSLFGTAALWWPALCALGAWQLVRRRIASFTWDTTALAVRMAGLILVLLGTCLLEALFSNIQQLKDHSFDIVGQGLRSGLTAPLGQHGATLVGISLVLCGVPLLTGLSWLTLMDEIGKALFRGLRGVGRFVRDRLLMAKERYDERRDARLPVSDELDDDVPAEPSWLSRKLSHLANTLGIHRGEPELQDHTTDTGEAIRRTFTPEFRNRLDSIITFKPLDTDAIHRVVDKCLIELQAQLDEKRVQLDVDHDAREWLAEKGYDKAMGARPMMRLVQTSIKVPLADMLLFGELAEHGGIVRIRVNEKGDALALSTDKAVADA